MIENGRLKLDGKDGFMLARNATKIFRSPIHYRPKLGVFGDPIPFYWQGEYHVFYLLGGNRNVSWEHIVSRDLIHWSELPTALVSDGAPDSPDGGHMFTGCVLERAGSFHIFYTGHNPGNPRGLEFVMHATSPDLVHWTKHPEDLIAPDDVHYAVTPHNRNWRDPYVFWNEEEQQYWMLLFASQARDGKPVQGLLTSKNLKHWKQEPPLEGAEGQECPDMFRIGEYYYLIGGGHYASARRMRGPYQRAGNSVIDAPGVYAGKRMFDGRRHIWSGWAWDTAEQTDDDVVTWGGYQCLPRELYAGPQGQLYCRPAAEVPAVFTQTVFELKRDAQRFKTDGPLSVWQVEGPVLKGTSSSLAMSPCRIDLPVADYLLECQVKLDPAAEFRLAMHEQPITGEGYFLSINPAKQEVALGSRDMQGKAFTWTRQCALDQAKPLKLQIFVQGSLIECFVNDAYAFTRRAYNFPRGAVGLKVTGGAAEIQGLTIKTTGNG